MEPTKEQLSAMRKDADRRVIAETLPSFSVDEMRRVLLFLQQTISARGHGIVQGQLVPDTHPPVSVPKSEERRGFAWRRAPKLSAPNALPQAETAGETDDTPDGLDGRRLLLYRRLGRLSASQLDEIQASIDQMNPIVAAESEDN